MLISLMQVLRQSREGTNGQMDSQGFCLSTKDLQNLAYHG